MNQFLASALLAAVVLAIVYVYMRVMSLEKEVKSMRNRAPPVDLAQAVWNMASEPPPEGGAHADAAPEMMFELSPETAPASNEVQLEKELERALEQAEGSGDDDEELPAVEEIERFPPPPTPPSPKKPPPADPDPPPLRRQTGVPRRRKAAADAA